MATKRSKYVGARVRYVPDCVCGDKFHPECEDGFITGLESANVAHVRFTGRRRVSVPQRVSTFNLVLT